MRPIRIMHILSDLEIGGAQQVVLDIVRNLDRSRFEPRVCCLRGTGALLPKLEEARVPHHLVYFNSRLSLFGLWQLRQLLREKSIDIVHTHLRRANLSGRLGALLAGTPVLVAHVHDSLRHPRLHHRQLDNWLARRTDRLLAISDAVAEAQAAAARLPKSAFTTLYNFIDPQAYRAEVEPQLARADLGVPAGEPCVGIVGRLHPIKRHDLFLDAAYELNQRRPELHFLICGEGRERDRLRAQVRRLGMQHKVTFTGAVHEMARVYRALDCLVLTSDSEGLGRVLLEAQAAGVPVVARAVGGVPEALSGGGGLLVNEATPQAVAGAVEAALAPQTARMLRSQMAANLHRFDAGRQITVLEDIYEDLCRRKGIGEPLSGSS